MVSLFRTHRILCAGALLLLMRFGGLTQPVMAQTADTSAVEPPNCAPATAEAILDVGNVRAKILNNGGLFWSGDDNVYEVPRGGGVHAIFSANLWIGGMVEDELRVAASAYLPREFWPGPIPGDIPSPELCAEYDRLWEVGVDDLRADRASEKSVQSWPVDAGAPFIDVDGDGAYRPAKGDRPELLGDQQLWWVMNDASGPHLSSKSDSLAIEIRATAFAFNAPGAVGNSTFYRYRIRNRSTHPIQETYAGIFADTDLGSPFDDYIGSDTTLGMGFTYNGTNNDEFRGVPEYGLAPPALGITVLKRPQSSAGDPEACAYPDTRDFGFTNMMYYRDGGGVIAVPPDLHDFYNYLQGRWKDGQRITFGGNGRDFSDTPTRFMYPGDPVTGSYWSEVNSDSTGRAHPLSDRRFVNSLGPFCMAPGEKVELVVAIVWSRGSSHLDSVRQLREDVAYIQSIRDAILTPRALPAGKSLSLDPELPFAASVYPNPVGETGGGAATVRFSTPEALEVSVDVFNALGQRVYVAAEPGLVDEGEHSWTLPTSAWAPGMYLVRITAGHTVTTRQLVVAGID